MSTSVAKKLVKYRSWIVAVTNAAVTWVILIIAPLGLFAVIACTVAVFIATLAVSAICDRVLFQLLRNLQRDVMEARSEKDHPDLGGLSSYIDLPAEQQKEERK
ncbi:CRISPR-associated protein Csx18 [Nostoc sp. TCL26-01]|uniref:CRISPR-associated protein Csx18 n=1 Tax=Nostoc sp. TCL26-01 TaxID=2576904 RepID=UPI0015BAB73F|nr:CRISPR-associated protein Csx18 [Nostoc sp. TCL26-01]QLE54769.1 hypothetical protein FD725_04140 [Nostoc sp. TCL26-01]